MAGEERSRREVLPVWSGPVVMLVTGVVLSVLEVAFWPRVLIGAGVVVASLLLWWVLARRADRRERMAPPEES